MAKNLLIYTILTFSMNVQALLLSDVDFSVGFSSIDVTAGKTFKSKIEEPILQFNYNIIYAGPDLSFNLNFSEIAENSFDFISYTRLGLGVKWYFFGLNGEKYIIDNKSTGIILRPTPYIGTSLGISNFSFSDGPAGDFNTSNIDLLATVGIEVPLSSSFLGILQIEGLTNIASSDEESKSVSYLGFLISAGIKISNF